MTLDPRMETEHQEIVVRHAETCALARGTGTRCTCVPISRVVASRAGGSDV